MTVPCEPCSEKEQWSNLTTLSFVLNWVSVAETLKMIQTVYGIEAMSCKNVLKWYGRVCDGKEGTENDPQAGPSLTVWIEKLAAILKNYHW